MTTIAATRRIVIIGAGHGGGVVAGLLRQYGHEGPITLFGDELLAPYQRPPLSKAWLKGEADGDSLALKPPAFYTQQNVQFRPGVRVVQIDRAARRVILSAGVSAPYDLLIIATGARSIPIPVEGADLDGVLSLRTAADADRLKAALGEGRRLAIVGGGYIGLEVAASARALGSEVTVLEREARVLARVACPELSNFVTAYHQSKGVNFELGCSVTAFTGSEGRLTGVVLSDGRTIACDVAVVGIGARPNDQLATAAGLETDDGILVDLDARTSDPTVFAIGDVTRRPMPIYECMFRLESVPNVLEQAKQAASAIMGRPRPPNECPWQWSDQYDLKLQIAGYPIGVDDRVVRGDPLSGRFAVFHLGSGCIQSVEALNSPAEFMMGRQLILNRALIDREKLSDETCSMKNIAFA